MTDNVIWIASLLDITYNKTDKIIDILNEAIYNLNKQYNMNVSLENMQVISNNEIIDYDNTTLVDNMDIHVELDHLDQSDCNIIDTDIDLKIKEMKAQDMKISLNDYQFQQFQYAGLLK